jgi:2-polyprenyl-3-methyl-5-hydroxy-6-metoxy-1,4-benzoquinol methylase
MAGLNTHAIVLDSLAGRTGRVADLGCGQGALSIELARRGFDVFCADMSPDHFRMQEVPGTHHYLIDLNGGLPHRDRAFDVVCAVEIIEHLENPRHFLRECRRIVKDNGLVIVTTPNVLSLASRLSFLFRGCLIYFNQGEYERNNHISPLRLTDFANMFREVGLALVRIDFNTGKLPIPKIRHWIPLTARAFRNVWLGESLIIWASRR